MRQAAVEWLIETNQVLYRIFSGYQTYDLIYDIAASSVWSSFFPEYDACSCACDSRSKAAISEADSKAHHAYV